MNKEFLVEKAVQLFRLWLGNAWNKGGLFLIGGGISVLAGWIEQPVKFLLASIWPSTPISIWNDTPERIGWTLIALGIALLVIGSYKTKPVNPHDLALMKKFRKVFTVQQVDFLANHNFHDHWHSTMIDDIQDVADSWVGAQFEFVDKRLNGLLVKVKNLSREFADQENLGFNVKPGGPTRTMKTNADRNGLTPETEKRIKDLTAKSRNLADAVNKLERVARRRMPSG